MKKTLLSGLLGLDALAPLGAAHAQDAAPAWQNPAIKTYGKIVDYKNVKVRPDPKLDYKLLFSVSNDKTNGDVSATLWSLARTVNLLKAGGVPQNHIHIVAVFHGAGIDAALSSATYKARKGIDNPNLDLMKQLSEAGVTFFACGQTLATAKLTAADLNPYTQMSYSALMVLANYQLEGYALMSM